MKKIYQIILLFSISIMIFANNEGLNIRISSTTLNINEATKLEVEFENIKKTNDLEIIGIDNFKILNKSTSSQTSIINGLKSKKVVYSYMILPKEKGNFELYAKTKKYKSNRLRIKVSGDKKTSNVDKQGILELKTELSKDKIFFGEKVILKYSLFRKVNLDSKGFKEKIKLNDFVVKDIEKLDAKEHFNKEGNIVAITEEVAKKILTPIKSGEFTIPSYSFQANVSQGGSSFFSNSIPKYLNSSEKKLTVLELPELNKPTNFSGIVGEVQIDSSHSSNKIKYGDAVTLKVKLSGNCNLDNLNSLVNSNLDNFKIYESVKESKEGIIEGKYHSEKNYEIIIVPKKDGKVIFPEIKITFFNPTTEKYEEKIIKGFSINVEKNNQIEDNEKINLQTNNVENVVITQIGNTKKANEKYYILKINKKILNYVILSLAIFVIIIFLIIIKKKTEKIDDYKEIYLESKKAFTSDEYLNILNKMIKYKYNVSIKASSLKNIENKIDSKKVLEIINECLENGKKLSSRDWQGKIKALYIITK